MIAATKDRRNTYKNNDTREEISFVGKTVNELFRHDYKNEEHLASILAVPSFIEQGRFIGSFTDAEHRKTSYYVSKFEFDGKQYLVSSTVQEKEGQKYYDHKLSSFDKAKSLIIATNSLTRRAQQESSPSVIEDSRLLSILQGFSRVSMRTGSR